MKKCDEPFFDVCRECNADATGKCIAEREYMNRVIAKLDMDEMLFILWLLAKAKGAGQWDEETFAAAIADAMGR